MDFSIAFINDVGVRFPPGELRDPLIVSIKFILLDLNFIEFHNLCIYMQLIGKKNPYKDQTQLGVVFRFREDKELVATCLLDGVAYKFLGGRTWNSKLNGILDAVILTLQELFKHYDRVDSANEFEYYKEQLESIKLAE